MNFATHQVAHRIIDDAMPANRIFPGEGGSDYMNFVMAAVAGAGMAGVPMGLVLDGQGDRIEYGQALAEQFDGVGTHAGSTFLNGLMVTFS